jgi:hypothetical protein
MKISLALVLVSLFVLTVAKSGFLHERREHHHHHHHHQCEGQDQSTNLGSTTHPAAAGPGTPIPVTTPTSNPNAAPYQGAPTPSVAHSSLASYPSPAILPAATYASSGGWVQLPKGEASFTTYTGCQEPCESSIHFQGHSELTLSVTSSSSLRSASVWVLRCGKSTCIRCQPVLR